MFTREILDSEDEGSDFSPAKGAIDEGTNHAERVTPNVDKQSRGEPHDANTTNSSSLKSTDPSFFQRIYDEQRAAASGDHEAAYLEPVEGPTSDVVDQLATQPRAQSQTKDSSSLTYITNPVPASHKLRKTYESRKKDIVDLTQVTTPSRERPTSEEIEPWDVPSSPLPTSAKGENGISTRSLSKAARTYGKRKREKAGEESGIRLTQDLYDFPSTADPLPIGERKRTKRGIQGLLREVSSPVVIPQAEEGGSGRRSARRGRESSSSLGYESVIYDTGTALYIAPSALTASQKQEYQFVSLSSDPGEPSLPVATGVEELHKSSGATTIAYSTPSRFGSSARRALASDGLQSLHEIDEEPGFAGMHPSSSPDVISEEPGRKKRERPAAKSTQNLFSELGPPLETRSAKKRKMARAVEDVYSLEEDALQDYLEHNGQRTQQGRGYEEPLGASETGEHVDLITQPNDTGIHQDSAVDPPAVDQQISEAVPEPNKKRGRKKKETKVEEAVVEDNVEEQQPDTFKESPEPANNAPAEEPAPVKKKRGRPRKSAVKSDINSVTSESIAPVEPPPKNSNDVWGVLDEADSTNVAKLAKLGKRGRKRKAESTKSEEYVVAEEEDIRRDPHLSETSQNSRPSTASTRADGKVVDEIHASDDDDDDEAKENQPNKKAVETPAKKYVVEKKEVVKLVTATPSTASKVQYRVGLSKKSRIAPLLKSLRK